MEVSLVILNLFKPFHKKYYSYFSKNKIFFVFFYFDQVIVEYIFYNKFI